jgi:predicted dehydrogenase
MMNTGKVVVGFIGAGGIARSHAYALNSLRYYYNEIPEVVSAAVCSTTEKSRSAFAARFGFQRSCDPDEFFADTAIDTVYILSPNNVHFRHLKAVTGMPYVKRVYLEKPVCSDNGEMESIAALAASNPQIRIQVGFQYLFSSSVREALLFWISGSLGRPLHFEVKYYHGDYLDPDYRGKRKSRLTPAPDGGAMADLGSHAISLLMAFLGDKLRITGAVQSGSFRDVPEGSDLFSLITLYDEASGAAGTLAASRVSSGTGDSLSIELYSENGALKYSSDTADYFEYFTSDTGKWHRQNTGSNYRPVTSFPSGHVPAGWLRAMVHAHYVFLSDSSGEAFIPGIDHGLAVQRIVNETAEHLAVFRLKTSGPYD